MHRKQLRTLFLLLKRATSKESAVTVWSLRESMYCSVVILLEMARADLATTLDQLKMHLLTTSIRKVC